MPLDDRTQQRISKQSNRLTWTEIDIESLRSTLFLPVLFCGALRSAATPSTRPVQSVLESKLCRCKAAGHYSCIFFAYRGINDSLWKQLFELGSMGMGQILEP